jgi:hypothetical protein
MVRRVC